MKEIEIIHEWGGKTFTTEYVRRAVRAIIWMDDKILLVYSAGKGDYKFPGGGIEDGESPEDALTREVLEECGVTLSGIGGRVIRATEKRQSMHSGDELFTMVSDYYICTCGQGMVRQNLDPYEKDLGFEPRWIELEKALEENRALSAAGMGGDIPWLDREIKVMEALIPGNAPRK